MSEWWPDLRERRLVGELMDDPALPAAELDAALRGLQRLNMISASWRVFTPALRRACAHGPIRVLDAASGGGDNVAALMRWARAKHLPITFHACDVNPAMAARTLSAMREVDPATPDSASFCCDVVQGSIPGEYHVVINALFLHHLARDGAMRALANLHASASRALVVSDLVRSRANWLAVLVASRVLTSSQVVRIDALRSIEAAWTPRELATLAREAGMVNALVRPARPARMLLTAFNAEPKGNR